MQERSDADGAKRKASLPGLNAGELEDLLDHVGEPAAFGAHQLDRSS